MGAFCLFSEMNERINQRLTDLESEHGFRILYACESGSRAWGFASADSDYDIRFLYVWPQEHYLSIMEPKDMIDLGVDDENLDITGWDIRKALRLGRKSNGSLTEWLFSPVVYFENTAVMDRWRTLATECFVPRASAAHYLGLSQKMCSGILDAEKPVTAKKYLYALRSLLAARFVIENQQPVPVAFSELRNELDLPDRVTQAMDAMISEKSGGAESDGIERNPVLDDFLDSERSRLGPMLSELPDEPGDIGAIR